MLRITKSRSLLRRSSPETLQFMRPVASSTDNRFLKHGLGDPFPQKYDSKAVESGWSDHWCHLRVESKRARGDRPVFSMILPPPNVTGHLHLGHALTVAVQDVLIRWHAMKGFYTTWTPGFDHAGLATQVVVEKRLKASTGLTRHDIGRKAFLKEAEDWKDYKRARMKNQLGIMGALLDWEDEYYTMGENSSKFVRKSFVDLFDAGLVYRGERIVNWCPSLRSTVSEVEVDRLELDGEGASLRLPGLDDDPITIGTLTTFAYEMENAADGVINVATTRPETMFGDVALAVNPSDHRYSHLIGKRAKHPFVDRLMHVIADGSVDPTFGTGVVKVTPAHDRADFELGIRHHLKAINIFDDAGNLNEACGAFAGMGRYEARRALLEALHARGLLVSREPHPISLPICSRTGDVIEPMIREQWFLKSRTLADKVLEALRSNRIQVVPEEEQDRLEDWFVNLRDWCLSRQVWWGHPIPAFRCCIAGKESSFRWIAAESASEARLRAAEWFAVDDLHQVTVVPDQDVLDTWFSSALLPLALSRIPRGEADVKIPYPLSVMETGRDILVFWVARMLLMAAAFEPKNSDGQSFKPPFESIVLHGLVVDADGKKMSKSKGNAVDPSDVIRGASLEDLQQDLRQNHAEGVLSDVELASAIRLQALAFPTGVPACGSDALRMTLLYGDVKSPTVSVDVTRARTMAAFANKLWQATRFVVGALDSAHVPCRSHYERSPEEEERLRQKRRPIDAWILSKLAWATKQCDSGLRGYDFHVAVAALYEFWYSCFCDVYLEACKSALKGDDADLKVEVAEVLDVCLDGGWRLLYPFMPHLADELYHRYHRHFDARGPPCASLLNAPYPDSSQWEIFRDAELEEAFDDAKELIEAIRRAKDAYKFSKLKPSVSVQWPSKTTSSISRFSDTIVDLARVQSVEFVDPNSVIQPGHLKVPFAGQEDAALFIQVQGVVADEDLRKRLHFLEKRIEELKTKMAHKKFARETPSRRQQVTDKLAAFQSERDQLRSFFPEERLADYSMKLERRHE